MKNRALKPLSLGLLLLMFLTAGAPAYAISCREMVESVKRAFSSSVATVTGAYQPAIESQPALKFSSSDPHYSAVGAKASSSYWEERADGKVLWRTSPHEGYEAVNGLDVIAARLYEFFGYKTSEPRVTVVDGKKVVLRKSMDGWRTINGHKVKQHNLDTMTGLGDSYRRLFFAAAFLGDRFRIGMYNNSYFGNDFSLNDFSEALRGPLQADSNVSKILEAVPTAWLPLNHPWRSLNSADIKAFQDRLRQLNDSTIKGLIRLGQLNDSALEHQLFTALQTRRDALLSNLSENKLPARLSQTLVDAEQKLTADNVREPYETEERNAYFNERTRQIQHHEVILTAFARGEHLNLRSAQDSFHFLEEMEKRSHYQLSTSNWKMLLTHLIETADSKDLPNLRDHRRFGATVINWLFLNRSIRPDLLQAYADVLLSEYTLNAGRLQKVLNQVWEFPDTDSRDAYEFFQTHAKAMLAQHQTRAVEIMLLSIVSAGLDHAEEFDGWLSRGGGYHNTYRINSGLNHGAQAIDDFLALNVSRSELTANLKLDKLAEILRAMTYQGGSGRRAIGPRITAAEAFNLGGATRQETYNVYDVVRAYVIGKLKVLPEILLKQIEPPK